MKWFQCIGYILFFNKFLNILSCTTPSFENLTVQANFNLNKFLGIWFEIQWLPGPPYNQSDLLRNYYRTFQFENSSIQRLVAPGKARELNDNICFSLEPLSIIANNSAKMILERQSFNNTKTVHWPYYILKTDYEHYLLIYGCATENYAYTDPCKDPTLWLFSRTTSLSSAYLTELHQYINDQLCINLTQHELTPQDGEQCYSSSNLHGINLILLVFLFFLFI